MTLLGHLSSCEELNPSFDSKLNLLVQIGLTERYSRPGLSDVTQVTGNSAQAVILRSPSWGFPRPTLDAQFQKWRMVSEGPLI